MRGKRKGLACWLVIIIFLSVFIVSIEMVRSITSDVDYIFENDSIFNETNPNVNCSQNILNSTKVYSENYTASHDFLNEVAGTSSTSIDFIDTDNSGIDCDAEIIQDYRNHNLVLNCSDYSNTNYFAIYNEFNDQEYGSVDFWFSSSDTSLLTYFVIEKSGVSVVSLRTTGGNLEYRGHTVGWQTIQSIDNYHWYHMRIDFECGLNTYMGLAEETFYITIRGVRYGAYETRTSGITYGSELKIQSDSTGTDYYNIYDSIGYSWDGTYTINDNLLPDYTELNITQIEGYSFNYESVGNFYNDGDDNPEGWSDNEDTGDYVNIDELASVSAPFYSHRNRDYRIDFTTGCNRGFEKDFYISGNQVNVTFNYRYWKTTDQTGYTDFKIYSIDDTEVVRIRQKQNDDMVYWDGVSEQSLRTNAINNFHHLIVYINHNDSLCHVFHYEINSLNQLNYLSTYTFPLLSSNKSGLGKIEIQSIGTGTNTGYIRFDDIGIFDNGISDAQSYGVLSYNMSNIPNWNFEYNNLITSNMSGLVSIVGYENYLSIDYQFNDTNDFNIATPFYNYNGTNALSNIYDQYIDDINNPMIAMFITNSSNYYSLGSLRIEGVKLTEGIIEYFPTFSYGNILSNESYFYVDTNNNLLFELSVDSGDLEYIQLEFNVNSQYTQNASVSFNSDLDGSSSAYLRLSYIDATSSVYEFPYYEGTTNVFLPQDKELDSFIVLVSDEDLFTAGSTNGYIEGISLIHVRNIEITIATVAVMVMLLPLLVMLIPTFLVSSMFDKKTRKLVIVPMLMIMSIACIFGSLIPSWLFFIQIICLGILLLFNRGEDSL